MESDGENFIKGNYFTIQIITSIICDSVRYLLLKLNPAFQTSGWKLVHSGLGQQASATTLLTSIESHEGMLERGEKSFLFFSKVITYY